jgi:hypothetical protein
MKKLIAVVLALSLTGCATIHRHPVLSGIVVGAAAGVTVGLLTRSSCPNRYDGKPYSGTPPCPK